MHYVLLWTDISIYLFSALFAIFCHQIYKYDGFAQSVRLFFSSRRNASAFIFLLFFFSVAVLDSFHFRTDRGIESLLDFSMSVSALPDEKTYSAPFSIYSTNKESVVAADGSVTRDYVRLEFAGRHINDSDQVEADLKRIIITGLTSAYTLIPLGLILISCVSIRRRYPERIPIGTVFISLSILLLGTRLIAEISPFYHVLGTNKVGVDVLYESIKGIRTAIVFGSITTLSILPFAVPLGISAGFFKGWVDDIIQYIYTTLSAIPSVLLIAAMVLLLDMMLELHLHWFQSSSERADARLLMLCLILGATSWTGLCRLIRAEVLKLSSLDYIQAARCLGSSGIKICHRHLLPNVRHIILISLALDFSGFILAEAVLSYIGVGVDPMTYSWGSMINSARIELSRTPVIWWSLFGAFVFMFTLVVSANLLADGLRDHLDPRVSNE